MFIDYKDIDREIVILMEKMDVEEDEVCIIVMFVVNVWNCSGDENSSGFSFWVLFMIVIFVM